MRTRQGFASNATLTCPACNGALLLVSAICPNGWLEKEYRCDGCPAIFIVSGKRGDGLRASVLDGELLAA